MSGSGAGGPGYDGFDLISSPKGFMAKNRMEIFSHHTYDLIKKKDEEIKELTLKLHKADTIWQDQEKEITELKSLESGFNQRRESFITRIKELEKELEQQRFNNKHNLSIDQKVSDEIKELRAKLFDAELFSIIDKDNVAKLRGEVENLKKEIANYTDARFWTEKGYDLQIEELKARIEDPNSFLKEIKEALLEIQEESEWGYYTLKDKLLFGLNEPQAVYRRETRCKGVFMNTISKVKELINKIGE